MAELKEIQDFAKELVGLTDRDEDVWINHALQRRPADKNCIACSKHELYSNIVEALER